MGEKMRNMQARRKELARIQQKVTPDMFVQANVDELIKALETVADNDYYADSTKALGRLYWSKGFTAEEGKYVVDESLRQLEERCDGMKVCYYFKNEYYEEAERYTKYAHGRDTTPSVTESSYNDLPISTHQMLRKYVDPGERYGPRYTVCLNTTHPIQVRVADALVSAIMGPVTEAETDAQPRRKLFRRVMADCMGMVFDENRAVHFDWSPPKNTLADRPTDNGT
jgi:hypothetical protein